MKKLFSFFIIVIVAYIVLVFLTPSFADTIGSFIGTKTLNEKIRVFKTNIDKTATSATWKDDFLKSYSDTIGSARQVKDTIVEKTLDTKKKIDIVRSTFSWAEETVNEVKDTVDSVNKTLNDVNKLWESIKSIVNTGAIQ